LIGDIIRYTTENSKITLDVQTNNSYDHITIRISDNGRKISSISQTIVRHLVNIHHGMFRSEYLERQGNTVIIQLPIKKDAFAEDYTSSEQASPFHIPSNIELNIPTIEIPTGFEEGDRSLGEIIQEAYISADQEFVQRAIRCINEHMMDSDYDRETFAADMGASPSSLYNKIRALTGKSITNFIRDIRIQAACRMAKENPDLRISDIAYRVGFRDPKYFATSFKRVIGTQPKEYFEKLRAE
jgi:AraC-like DNA-binding protein